jgi:hypothetical protein
MLRPPDNFASRCRFSCGSVQAVPRENIRIRFRWQLRALQLSDGARDSFIEA